MASISILHEVPKEPSIASNSSFNEFLEIKQHIHHSENVFDHLCKSMTIFAFRLRLTSLASINNNKRKWLLPKVDVILTLNIGTYNIYYMLVWIRIEYRI